MVIGVTDGYDQEASRSSARVTASLAKGHSIEFALGYSHSITVDPAQGHHLHGRGHQPS
jgi:large subunit ribosomal protein L6